MSSYYLKTEEDFSEKKEFILTLGPFYSVNFSEYSKEFVFIIGVDDGISNNSRKIKGLCYDSETRRKSLN